MNVKELEIVQQALLEIGTELSNCREGYIWDKDLSKLFTKADNLIKKEIKLLKPTFVQKNKHSSRLELIIKKAQEKAFRIGSYQIQIHNLKQDKREEAKEEISARLKAIEDLLNEN